MAAKKGGSAVKKSVNKIRDECDNIEKNVEDKEGKTYGDPIVEIKE